MPADCFCSLDPLSAVAEPRPELLPAPELCPVPRATDANEFNLLLACCSAASGTRRVRKAVDDSVDWPRFFGIVEHHRVVPQVYRALSQCSDSVPDIELAALKSVYEENARKALWFTGELVRILDHLRGRGIEAIPHKGPALAQFLYDDVTARQFSDLDIIVRPPGVVRAKAALAELGYAPEICLTAREERAYIDSGYEYSFNGPHGDHLLELQWRILPRFYAVDSDSDDLFRRVELVSLGGRSFPTLSAEDLLLALCVHAAKHVWVQLSWLCDIARLIESAELNWEEIRESAGRLGIVRIVSLNLLLAEKLLDAQMPPGWPRSDRRTQVLADEILQIIERSAYYHTESMAYFKLMVRLRERRRDRARFLGRLISTPSVSEWSAVRLPEPLFPLYRVVRLARLAKRFAQG